MGHREQLLAGAKRCLQERGYARTTARDIVDASGTNLASIGYHFGSKDALLTAAMIEVMNEWGDELERAVTLDPEADPLDRLEAIWAGVIRSITAHRPLWAASVDILTQTDHQPELRERLAAAVDAGRVGFSALILDGPATGDSPGTAGSGDGAPPDGVANGTPPGGGADDTPQPGAAVSNGTVAGSSATGPTSAVGALVMAVITGLSVQWLLDPERAPSARDITDALRAIQATVEPARPGPE
ncbi:TetR/AcrR family transcriptional regulator [Plantactinospora sonchi]|uniref:TetR/AcrR family transcriptional regulator n=1 Tax=Plantactinospora sonchi TaxID=1544735 RepID=A0ABU7RLP5_9ACTN